MLVRVQALGFMRQILEHKHSRLEEWTFGRHNKKAKKKQKKTLLSGKETYRPVFVAYQGPKDRMMSGEEITI